MKKVLVILITLGMMLIPNSAKAQHISDREAAAIALGTAALIAGVAIASQRNRHRHHHHYYAPAHPTHPYPLRYRYTEPRDYIPPPYYYNPYYRY